MVNFYGIESKYKVFENPVNDKVVVSTEKGGIDELELASKIRDAKILRTKLDEKKISADAKKLNALEKLNDLMTTFDQANTPLMNYLGSDNSKPNVFKNLVANGSSINGIDFTNYITATADFNSNLIGAQYTVSVSQMAKNDLLQSTSSISAPSAAQNLNGNFYINGTAIALVATDTMTDVVRKINAVSSTTGVTAYTAQISPTNTNVNFFLQATSIAKPIDITPNASDATAIDPTTALSLPASSKYNGNAAAIAAYQQTLQAAVTMNGTTYYRNTNTVSDLIEGVTLSLKNPMSGGTSTTISFGMDNDAIVQATMNWIDAFNAVKIFLKPHLQKAKDDDPNGVHALFQNPIVEKTLRLLNQINTGVNGLTSKSALSSYTIGFLNQGDASSILSYDPVKLAQTITTTPLDFLKTMGQNFTSTNPKINVLSMPEQMNVNFANSPLALNISNITTNASGQIVYDATLSYTTSSGKTYSEKLSAVYGNVMEFKDTNNFAGFSFLYNGNLPSIGGSDSTIIQSTQGIAGSLNGNLAPFLQEPFNISLSETLPLSDLNFVDWGDLSEQTFLIFKEKKQLEKGIESKIKIADEAYERTVAKLQRFNSQADKSKQIKDMINYISMPKH
ncbi:MAG: hypothetical protein HEEMFOPI_01104 [Holosporales bacterium]